MEINRFTRLIATGMVIVAGGAFTAVPASAARHHSSHRSRHHSHHSAGSIPQHNGGDMDADNSGAASDGDGNA